MKFLSKVKKVTAGDSKPMFRDGKYNTADQKAKIYKALVRFLDSDFDPRKFTKDLYRHLTLSFGFIAHYNLAGFYHERFAEPDGRVETYKEISQASQWNFNDENTSGNGDLNKAIQELVVKNKSKFIDAAKSQKIQMLIEQREKIGDELKRLGHKE